MKQTDYNAGYISAVDDMLELLDNALANGSMIHYYHELVDELKALKEVQEIVYD